MTDQVEIGQTWPFFDWEEARRALGLCPYLWTRGLWYVAYQLLKELTLTLIKGSNKIKRDAKRIEEEAERARRAEAAERQRQQARDVLKKRQALNEQKPGVEHEWVRKAKKDH